jgi:hypothetical protein
VQGIDQLAYTFNGTKRERKYQKKKKEVKGIKKLRSYGKNDQWVKECID